MGLKSECQNIKKLTYMKKILKINIVNIKSDSSQTVEFGGDEANKWEWEERE